MTTAPAQSPAAAPAGSPRAVVQCLKLVKVFKDFWLRNRVVAVGSTDPASGKVIGIDLDIREGEVFGLLGPNGSGKSTTIKLILGLLHPTAGHIAVYGQPPNEVEIKKQIGYLPEESYLYRFLTARETLDYYGRLFYQKTAVRKERIDQLLAYVGLERAADRPVGEFSKGMQRRIGLAQALINDPKLLILDEPTTGMDPIGTKQIKDLILDLKQRGKTILLCSHLLADVEDVTDRVAVMYGGQVRKNGQVSDLLTNQQLTTLYADQLDEDTINAIDELLRARGKHLDRVEHPRQKLEDFFLDIVHEAQQQGAAFSGASAGGQLAGFLDHDEPKGDALIDSLTRAEPTEPVTHEPEPGSVATEPVTPETPAVAAEHDAGVLGDLLGDAAEDAPPPTPSADTSTGATPTPPKPDEQADQSVLDDLLGGDSGRQAPPKGN
ncbi:MAG: ATP-binding cassette domain-containing protein [Planctomycetota bacterium]